LVGNIQNQGLEVLQKNQLKANVDFAK
jgi:hypothetical protein